jgi:hypothetical protein
VNSASATDCIIRLERRIAPWHKTAGAEID